MMWMSVVSLARAAGVTGLLSKRRLWMVSTSLVLADISMMSTQALLDDLLDDVAELGQAAIAQLAAVGLGRSAGAPMARAMSASLASARMKSLQPCGIGVDAGQLGVERFASWRHSFRHRHLG